MKIFPLFVMFVLAVICSAAHSSVQVSHWESNFNRMHLYKNGTQIDGNYEYAGGSLSGVMSGNILKGWWAENDDATNCGPGNKWSGPFVLTFSSDGKSFTGQYGKCDKGQTDFNSLSGDWHGRLYDGAPLVASAPPRPSGTISNKPPAVKKPAPSSKNDLLKDDFTPDFKSMTKAERDAVLQDFFVQ